MPRVSGGGERRGQSGGVSDEVSDAAGIVRGAPPLVSAPSFAREITDLVRTPLVRGRSDAGLRLAVLEILLSVISLAILCAAAWPSLADSR